MNQGWLCPKCSKVYAPWVKECGSCNGQMATRPQITWIPPTRWYRYPQTTTSTDVDSTSSIVYSYSPTSPGG